MLKEWNVSKEAVKAAAMENMKREMRLMPFEQVLDELGYEKGDELDESLEMYVLSNEKMHYGAGMVMNQDVQKLLGSKIEGDYYVLPSSVHEVLILADKSKADIDGLTALVQEINQTVVSQSDILSDKVQHYSVYAQVLENAYSYEQNVKDNPQKYGKNISDPAKEYEERVKRQMFG